MVQELKLHLPMQGMQVQSLVGELGSHMPLGPKTKTSKQKQYCNIFNKRLKNKTKNKWALEGDAGPSHASLESLTWCLTPSVPSQASHLLHSWPRDWKQVTVSSLSNDQALRKPPWWLLEGAMNLFKNRLFWVQLSPLVMVPLLYMLFRDKAEKSCQYMDQELPTAAEGQQVTRRPETEGRPYDKISQPDSPS